MAIVIIHQEFPGAFFGPITLWILQVNMVPSVAFGQEVWWPETGCMLYYLHVEIESVEWQWRDPRISGIGWNYDLAT